jgi:transcriptional regulator with XRE-family HTH domain
MTKKFGELFREERKRSGKTMGDLARQLSISVTFLSDVERGTRPPLAPERIRRAAELMGTTATSLQSLLRAAQSEQGAISLPLPASDVGREAGAALQRQWANLDDDAFATIMNVIEKKKSE